MQIVPAACHTFRLWCINQVTHASTICMLVRSNQEQCTPSHIRHVHGCDIVFVAVYIGEYGSSKIAVRKDVHICDSFHRSKWRGCLWRHRALSPNPNLVSAFGESLLCLKSCCNVLCLPSFVADLVRPLFSWHSIGFVHWVHEGFAWSLFQASPHMQEVCSMAWQLSNKMVQPKHAWFVCSRMFSFAWFAGGEFAGVGMCIVFQPFGSWKTWFFKHAPIKSLDIW